MSTFHEKSKDQNEFVFRCFRQRFKTVKYVVDEEQWPKGPRRRRRASRAPNDGTHAHPEDVISFGERLAARVRAVGSSSWRRP